MRNKDLPILAFLNFLYLLVACVAAQLFTRLILRFTVLFVELDFVAASVIRLVTLLVISLGLFSFLGYKDGYRSASFTKAEAVPVGIAALVHFLICLVFRFSPWLAGPTRHIAGFLSLGAAYNATERVQEIPFIALIAVGLFMAALWVGGFLLSSYVGFRKRLCDRAALTGNNENKSTTEETT